jgi:hypothetical protein
MLTLDTGCGGGGLQSAIAISYTRRGTYLTNLHQVPKSKEAGVSEEILAGLDRTLTR